MQFTLDTSFREFYRFIRQYEYLSIQISSKIDRHKSNDKIIDTIFVVAQKQLLRENKIKRVVFSAMCIESMMNSFGYDLMGADYEQHEMKSIFKKVPFLIKNATGVEITDRCKLNEILNLIFKRRNHYMHQKVKVLAVGQLVQEIFNSQDEYLDLERKSVDEFRELMTCYHRSFNFSWFE
jgi:hypothetical protein